MKKLLTFLFLIFLSGASYAAPIDVKYDDGIYHIVLSGDKIKKQMRNKIRFVKSVTAVSPVTFMLGSYFASNVIQKSYINEDIKYLNGDIWQGNIDAIKNKCITLTYNDDNYWKDVL